MGIPLDDKTYMFRDEGKLTLDELIQKGEKAGLSEKDYLMLKINKDLHGASYCFPNDKEKELLKKLDEASQKPEANLRELVVQVNLATQYMNLKHYSKFHHDYRPDCSNDVSCPYEIPDWMKDGLGIEAPAKEWGSKESVENLNKEIYSLKKERTSPVTITVPQYDDKGNIVKDRNGNPLTATLNCSQGIDAALGKLAKRCSDQEFKIKYYEQQLSFYKTNSISQQKSRSDNSGMEY